MPHKLVIVTAPSGTGVSGSLARVTNPTPNHVVKVEEALAKLAAPALSTLRDLAPGSTPSLMEALTLPRPVLTDLWPQALDKAWTDERVAERSQSETVFLSLHAAWLHIESGRVISEVHHPSLQQLQPAPTMVVTLIDDLYDNLVRLSRTGQLMEPTQAEGEERNPITVIAAQLVRLLSWREAEVRFAQQIANSLDVPHYLFAVKHPVDTFERLMTLPHPEILYNAHPITVPRRDLAREEAEEMIRDLSRLAAEFRASPNTVLLEPTSIDEFRLKEGRLLTDGSLTPRWPLPIDAEGQRIPLLWDGLANDRERAKADQPFKEMPSSPPTRDQIADAASAIDLLAQEISTQISWRDRQLVEQSHQIIQTRPFANPEGKVSSGVAAEIRLHRQLFLHEAGKGALTRRDAVIYHPAADEKNRRIGAIVAICRTHSKLEEITNWNDESGPALREALSDQDFDGWTNSSPEDVGLRIAEIFSALPITPRPEFYAPRGGAMEPILRAQELPRIRRDVGSKVIDAINGVHLDREYDLTPFQSGTARRLVSAPGQQHPAAIARELLEELRRPLDT